ncbi:MAG: FAD-dependent oxidoreductase [Cyanobacteria bacterium SW_9_44_58]|nr:MAG: FAD-dependent oxidoreductase [Cyanobacteria bacterium SW_9_44_58]
MKPTEQILSQLPGDVLGGLRKADQIWGNIRSEETQQQIPQVIQTRSDSLNGCEFDVMICGGTLGILLATGLQQQGFKVGILERGILQGREQEWNISRQEIRALVELGLLTEQELESAITSGYNPARVAFHQGIELWVNDVLNLGIDPITLLELLKNKFLNFGGQLLEKTAFAGATVHSDGVAIQTDQTTITTRLLVDAMGHFSPIVKQARGGEKPEGTCVVVGTCAAGYPNNKTGDLLASFTPIQNQCQYFWEAFPAKDGRTTYLFSYLDAHPSRPSLEFFMDEYFRLLPEYQQVELSQLDFKRALFGFFPAYRKSPLRVQWSRILPVGDSSGIQSPVSFGGFGAMIRHLSRLTYGIAEALNANTLSRADLALLQPYQPNISATWLFQRTMSVGINQQLSPNQINELLSGVFTAMNKLGDDVLKPFLQDVVQFPALTQTLALTAVTRSDIVLPVIPQVGITPLLDWLVHYMNLGIYSGLSSLNPVMTPTIKSLSPQQQYRLRRWLEAWQYGSGKDYHR